MNDIHENKLAGFEATEVVLNAPEHVTIWTPVANFAGLVTQFQNLITDIHTISMTQSEIITGYSTEKVETRAKLISATMKVINGVRTLAIFTEDQVLKDTVNYTYSDLRNSRDNVLTDIAGIVYDTANPLHTELEDYLVTQADITLVNTLRTEYLEQMEQPRAAKVSSKVASEELKLKFREVDFLLKEKMDPSIVIFKPGNPRFVNKYFDARIIMNRGVRHTGKKAGMVWGTVRDAGTTFPLENVLVRIVSTVRQTRTDEEGKYKFVFRAKGYPKFQAAMDGYQVMTQGPIETGLDMDVRLDFNLEAE